MILIPFEPEHVHRITLQPRQKRAISFATFDYLAYLKALGPSASAIEGDTVLASGGIVEWHMGTGTLWLYVCGDIQRYAVRLNRVLLRMLDSVKLRRVEATTERDWPESCRWLEVLGFEFEGVMRKYGPFGEDHVRYARIW